jgi:hypothetical protein
MAKRGRLGGVEFRRGAPNFEGEHRLSTFGHSGGHPQSRIHPESMEVFSCLYSEYITWHRDGLLQWPGLEA